MVLQKNKKNYFKNYKKELKILSTSINNYNDISKLIKKIKPQKYMLDLSYINYDFDTEFFNLNPSINGTNFY